MKLQETAFEKCRCFGGTILLVHFSGKAFTFYSQACPVSKKRAAPMGFRRGPLCMASV